MSAMFVRVIAGLLFVTGFMAVTYIAVQIPPYQSSGALDLVAVALLFIALLCGMTGLLTLIAFSCHRRWPALTGNFPGKKYQPYFTAASVALRQGFLLSFSLCAVLLFSMLKIIDSIFIFVIFLLSGLIEAYFQSFNRRA